MSLTSSMTIATSGMRAAQAGMRVVSDNIANVNTPGYARKLLDQSPLIIGSSGAGVSVDGIRRAADIYLQKASLDASAEIGRSGAVAEFLDRAQALFGDPSEPSSFFNRLDPIFSAFATASEAPTSGLHRGEANIQTERFFDDAAAIGGQLRELGRQADVRISSAVDRANGLLDDIFALNSEISRATITGQDATGAQNVQSQLIDELSGIIDLQIGRAVNGGVSLAAADGTLLTGENRARLEFAALDGAPGMVRLAFEFGQPVAMADGLGGGEIKGLIELRDKLLPEMREQLGEFTTRAADALNRAHNQATPTPAPTRLVGRPTFNLLADSIDGFTGRTAVAVTDADGLVQRRVDINFDAPRTMSIDGGAPTSWTPSTFLSSLSTALSPLANAVFDTTGGGILSIRGSDTARISVADDPARPSNNTGRGFSHYFGLNNLVVSPGPAFYDTGMTPADPHGFAAGGEISFRFDDGTGARFADVTVTIPAGGTLEDLRTALNATTGVAKFGAFNFEGGALRFNSKAKPQVVLSVLDDSTIHAMGGQSLSRLHGMGHERALRAENFALRGAIAADHNQLALAKFNFGAAVGARGWSQGDGRGAFALAHAGEDQIRFDRAGDAAGTSTTVSSYAAQMGGLIGRRSAIAAERADSAQIVMREASARRSSVEGVNLDEELIQLTVYQQAFNASARLITAAKEMYDVLLSIA